MIKASYWLPGIGSLARVFLPRLQVRQVLLSFFRFPPDTPVQDAHDCDRNVERSDGRPEGDVVVGLDELDVARVVGNRPFAFDVGPRVDPGGPQQQWDTPSTCWTHTQKKQIYYGITLKHRNSQNTDCVIKVRHCKSCRSLLLPHRLYIVRDMFSFTTSFQENSSSIIGLESLHYNYVDMLRKQSRIVSTVLPWSILLKRLQVFIPMILTNLYIFKIHIVCII